MDMTNQGGKAVDHTNLSDRWREIHIERAGSFKELSALIVWKKYTRIPTEKLYE